MSIDDLRISVKSLIPIALLALTILAMVALGANRLIGVSAGANAIIKNRDLGEVMLVRATRSMVFLPFDVLAMVSFDNDDAGGKAAIADFAKIAKETDELLDKAASLMPDRAQEIASFEKRFDDLAEKAKGPFNLAYNTPGAVHGTDLKPNELRDMAKAAKEGIEIDLGVRKLIAEMSDFGDVLLRENAASAEALEAEGRNAIWTLALIGILSTAAAGGFALWLSGAKVARPLGRMVSRMKALAAGDLSVEIGDDVRRDEIGEIARAVQIFKANAIERVRIEAEASNNRFAAEAERERAAQERAKAAEQLASAMGALREGLRRLAEGDLLARLESGFAAEYADVRDDFNAAAAKLKAALVAVVNSTGAIHSSSREISSASDNLSQRTEQQAASLEETAAALEEITTTVKTSAQGAKHASEVAANADADAKQGAIVVRKAVTAMDAISGSSTKIGQIIGVIDEIAFQTNLLALNAGVEAARAGDAGRGFAVVASEVRALAQRSADAAKEIKTLVSESGAQVEEGVRLVAESGKALASIIAQVSEINRVVADIANGAAQQATGLQQINAAIAQMDQSTQQNATMVEESTAASHSLGQEMNVLTRLVEQFRVAETDEDRLRCDLKKAVPHAFAKTPASASTARVATKVEMIRPVKAVGNASSRPKPDWTEF